MKTKTESSAIGKKRWQDYVVANTAGALSLLTPHSELDADVTFVELNQLILDREPGNGYFDYFGPYSFGASGALFSLWQAYDEVGIPRHGIMAVQGHGNISFVGFIHGPNYYYASNLPYGQSIALAGDFDVPAEVRGSMAWGNAYGTSYPFQFTEPGLSFLGFRFDVGAGTQYGFAEIIMQGRPENIGVLVGYGWAGPGGSVRLRS